MWNMQERMQHCGFTSLANSAEHLLCLSMGGRIYRGDRNLINIISSTSGMLDRLNVYPFSWMTEIGQKVTGRRVRYESMLVNQMKKCFVWTNIASFTSKK